jgi:hypothetical protein
MDRGNIEACLGCRSLQEIKNLQLNILVVEVLKFIGEIPAFQCDPGILFKIIIVAKIVFLEDLINSLASVAAKVLTIMNDMFIDTEIHTMITNELFPGMDGFLCHNYEGIKLVYKMTIWWVFKIYILSDSRFHLPYQVF